MKSFYTPNGVGKITGILYRQLSYWDKTDFLRPSYKRRGKYRLYTFSDLIIIWLICMLRKDAGFSIQKLRKTVVSLRNLLPQVAHPLVELTFAFYDDRILVFNGEVITNFENSTWAMYPVSHLRNKVNELFPEVLPPSTS